MKYLASKGVVVSIPQAVGTVATFVDGVSEDESLYVSIPQAVGTVATHQNWYGNNHIIIVSIPQAVGTVATAGSRKPVFMWSTKVVLENLKP